MRHWLHLKQEKGRRQKEAERKLRKKNKQKTRHKKNPNKYKKKHYIAQKTNQIYNGSTNIDGPTCYHNVSNHCFQ